MPIAVRPFPRRVVPLALAGALGLLAGCDQAGGAAAETASAAASDASGQAASTSPPVALPVATEEARDGDLILRVTTTGQVRSDALVPLRAEVPAVLALIADGRLRPSRVTTRVARFDEAPEAFLHGGPKVVLTAE